MSVWTRAGSAVAGIAVATAVVIGLFAIHRTWFGSAMLNPDWINGLAASVLGVALVFSWLERAPRLRRRLPRPVAIALATTLVVLSLGVYVALGDVQFPYHRWDQFHCPVAADVDQELPPRRKACRGPCGAAGAFVPSLPPTFDLRSARSRRRTGSRVWWHGGWECGCIVA